MYSTARFSNPLVARNALKFGKDFAYITLTDGLDHDYLRPPYVASTLTENTYTGSVATFGLDDIFDLFARCQGDISFLSCLHIYKTGRIAMSVLGGTDYDHPALRGPGGLLCQYIPCCPGLHLEVFHDARLW